MKKHEKSEALYQRAKGLIPALTQTLAKGPGQHVMGVAPKYLQRGKGARVWDVDGNEYVDYNMAIGPLVLGYADDEVDRAILAQLADGITFSLMHPLEVEVAEQVNRLVPCAESVRFSKTGADVTSAAVRLARAFTGRRKVVCCGYHGWHDWYVAVTDRARGIPEATRELTATFEYNDLDSLAAALDDDTACVILEPTVFAPPAPGFLEGVKALTARAGALLVFDEMWTGFRLALGGAQERFGVVPDLATFSKAIANGMPLSVLAGRRDVMSLLDKEVFFFTTFGGEALSLAAAQATMNALRERQVPAALAQKGKQLRAGVDEILAREGIGYLRCIGSDARTMLVFDAGAGDGLVGKSFVQQELLERGVLWSGFHTLSWSHGEREIEQLLSAYREVLPRFAQAVAKGDVRERLRGAPVEPVFRRVSNFNMKPAAKPAPGARP
jgi:glutamate-1-semialdehyde aminotransferase